MQIIAINIKMRFFEGIEQLWDEFRSFKSYQVNRFFTKLQPSPGLVVSGLIASHANSNHHLKGRMATDSSEIDWKRNKETSPNPGDFWTLIRNSHGYFNSQIVQNLLKRDATLWSNNEITMVRSFWCVRIIPSLHAFCNLSLLDMAWTVFKRNLHIFHILFLN